MLLTEEKAKSCACPQKLANAGFATPVGNDKCEASACMAWRFRPAEFEHKSELGLYRDHRPKNSFGTPGCPVPRTGFCGMAGKIRSYDTPKDGSANG